MTQSNDGSFTNHASNWIAPIAAFLVTLFATGGISGGINIGSLIISALVAGVSAIVSQAATHTGVFSSERLNPDTPASNNDHLKETDNVSAPSSVKEMTVGKYKLIQKIPVGDGKPKLGEAKKGKILLIDVENPKVVYGTFEVEECESFHIYSNLSTGSKPLLKFTHFQPTNGSTLTLDNITCGAQSGIIQDGPSEQLLDLCVHGVGQEKEFRFEVLSSGLETYTLNIVKDGSVHGVTLVGKREGCNYKVLGYEGDDGNYYGFSSGQEFVIRLNGDRADFSSADVKKVTDLAYARKRATTDINLHKESIRSQTIEYKTSSNPDPVIARVIKLAQPLLVNADGKVTHCWADGHWRALPKLFQLLLPIHPNGTLNIEQVKQREVALERDLSILQYENLWSDKVTEGRRFHVVRVRDCTDEEVKAKKRPKDYYIITVRDHIAEKSYDLVVNKNSEGNGFHYIEGYLTLPEGPCKRPNVRWVNNSDSFGLPSPPIWIQHNEGNWYIKRAEGLNAVINQDRVREKLLHFIEQTGKDGNPPMHNPEAALCVPVGIQAAIAGWKPFGEGEISSAKPRARPFWTPHSISL